VSSSCGDPAERVDVVKATPSVATVLSKPSVVVGGSVTDTAHLTGGFSPSGSVSWNVYAASDTNCQTPLNAPQALVASLSGGSAASPSSTPAAPGTYEFVAIFPCAALFRSVSSSCGDPAERVDVVKATPSVATVLSKPSVVVGGSV